MRMSQKAREGAWGYLFISPWIIGAAVLFIWPLFRSIYLSFEKVTDLTNLQTEWVGLANYKDIATKDVSFLPTLGNTMSKIASDVPLILVFSLVMAVLLARVTRGQTFLRTVFFLPVVIGSAAVIQKLIQFGAGEAMTESTLGPLMNTAQTSGEYGMGSAQGLVGPIQTVVTRLTTIIWHTGVEILLFVAGLNSIPESLYEAAEVDGATGWESFWKITLPMLSPVILVVTIYALVDRLTFPQNRMIEYILEVGVYGQQLMEYASAVGMIYFIFVVQGELD